MTSPSSPSTVIVGVLFTQAWCVSVCVCASFLPIALEAQSENTALQIIMDREQTILERSRQSKAPTRRKLKVTQDDSIAPMYVRLLHTQLSRISQYDHMYNNLCSIQYLSGHTSTSAVVCMPQTYVVESILSLALPRPRAGTLRA